MSADTKGCVVTESKDAFSVVRVVNKAIKALIENKTGEKGYKVNLIEGFSLPIFEIDANFEAVSCSFSYVGEQRKLSLIFCCDYDLEDYEEIKGEKCIWLSLGSWGSSVEIMRAVLKEMSSIGECYIDESDADDSGFVKV